MDLNWGQYRFRQYRDSLLRLYQYFYVRRYLAVNLGDNVTIGLQTERHTMTPQSRGKVHATLLHGDGQKGWFGTGSGVLALKIVIAFIKEELKESDN